MTTTPVGIVTDAASPLVEQLMDIVPYGLVIGVSMWTMTYGWDMLKAFMSSGMHTSNDYHHDDDGRPV